MTSMEVPVRVAELRRYPVKSMAGESLEHAQLGEFGMLGTQWFGSFMRRAESSNRIHPGLQLTSHSERSTES